MDSSFVAQEKDFVPRRQWLAFYLKSQGNDLRVVIGAAEALKLRKKKSRFIGCGRSGKETSYHDIVTVTNKETGQSLGKGRVNLVSQP